MIEWLHIAHPVSWRGKEKGEQIFRRIGFHFLAVAVMWLQFAGREGYMGNAAAAEIRCRRRSRSKIE
jgi:hypothetical protein